MVAEILRKHERLLNIWEESMKNTRVEVNIYKSSPLQLILGYIT